MRFSVAFVALLSLLGCVVDVDAHARLVSPTPWNPQPTKQQVCGVAAATAIPTGYAVSRVPDPTQPITVQWVVVVADGRGPLTARLDTQAKTNPTLADFTVTLTATGANNPQRVSNTPYQISFRIPAGTTCTGTGGICTLRVASSSGWVACSTIRMTAAAATAAPTIAPPRPTATAAPTIAPPPPTVEPAMPVPTTPAPIYPTGQSSNGAGGALGLQRVLATQSRSGLEYLINATAPQVAGRPQGVIIFLHGSRASNYDVIYDINGVIIGNFAGIRMFAQVAQQYDFIRVAALAPNRQGWNEPNAQGQVTAANMLKTLVQQDLLRAYNIDMAKVFFSGQSSGSQFLSKYFVPMHANTLPGGGAFMQCGGDAPASTVQFQPTAATINNFKLHFEISTGDTLWQNLVATAITEYSKTGMSLTMLNTKPGGHCRFDQQQVVLDRIAAMLPKPIINNDNNGGLVIFETQDANGDAEVFSTEASTKARCVVAQGLKSCPKVNGQSVQVLTTDDIRVVDAAAETAISFGLNNADIMTLPASAACAVAYRDMICATYFIPCGVTVAATCQASCTAANQACMFNQTKVEGDVAHSSIYDCTQSTYQQLYADANGVCAGAPAPLPGRASDADVNGALSYAQPMMFVTLLISFIAMVFH